MEQKKYSYDYPMSSATSTVIACFRDENEKLQIVAIRRKEDPFKGKLALPGGFQETGKENLITTAVREMKEETGITIDPEFLHLVTVQSAPNRDPRGVVIDHVYCIELGKKQLFQAKAGDDAASLELYEVEGNWNPTKLNKDFAFDHGDSIRQWLLQLQEHR